MPGSRFRLPPLGVSALLLAAVGAANIVAVRAHRRAARPMQSRPRPWAEPLELPGVENLHRVSAELYRGRQPTARGFRELEALGVRTVVNLRTLHSDAELLAGTELAYVEIPWSAGSPADEHSLRFLRVVTDPARTPVFVHCAHGADRTGTMCAVYRIVVQGWSGEEALAELMDGGFHFHRVWKDIPTYIRTLDAERLQRRLAAGGEEGPRP